MGNCCGKETPCHHTEDEKKGLLHSSESKTSTKTVTEYGISPTSDEEKGFEDTKPELEKIAVNKQPKADWEPLKTSSSHSTTTAMLHTDVPLASGENHNVSPKTPEVPTDAGCSAMETKIEAQDVQNNAAKIIEIPQDKAEATAGASTSQAKLEIDKSMEKQTVLATSQDSTFAPVKEAPAKDEPIVETPVKEAPAKDEPFEETSVKETSVEETSVKEAPVWESPVKGAPVEKTPNKKAPVKETPVGEAPVKRPPVEEEPVSVQVEAEKKSFKLKPETHVSDEKEMLQTGEVPLNDTTDVKHEEDGLELHDTWDVSVIDNSSTKPDSHVSGQSNDLDVTEKSVTKVAGEECTMESTLEEKVEENHLEDTHTTIAELQQENLDASEAQKYLQHISSDVVDFTNGLSPGVENGLVKDANSLSETNAKITVVKQLCQKVNTDQEPSGNPLDIKSEEPSSTPSTNPDSTFKMEIPDVKNCVPNEGKNENVLQEEQEASDPAQNGLDSTSISAASSPVEKTSEFVTVEGTEVKGEVTALIEDKSLTSQDGAEPEAQHTKEETDKQEDEADVAQANEEDSETQKGEVISIGEKVKVWPVCVPSEGSVEKVQNLDESTELYLGPEEIEMGASEDEPSKPVLELTVPAVERSSLAPAVDMLAYSEREWRGNTSKSSLIRKGYSEMSHSFSALIQVRGDNYCALRATLYQVLATSTEMPTWLQDEGFLSLPEMIEAREHLIGGWMFPSSCTWGSEKDSIERLKYYLDLFKKKWRAAAACESPEERRSLCEHVFQGGEEEFGLLEALKFLMLAKAIELHGNMMADQEVPVFCWLLFARDTSENPQTLLANHLSQIGFTGGVEQVEMFLLGYALQHTIQAFRLYMTDTDEFVTHYPDDHKQEWPCVCIVTEDDRHYNVPIRRTAQHQQRNDIATT